MKGKTISFDYRSQEQLDLRDKLTSQVSQCVGIRLVESEEVGIVHDGSTCAVVERLAEQKIQNSRCGWKRVLQLGNGLDEQGLRIETSDFRLAVRAIC